MDERRLTELRVSEFVQAVASADQPVPAGGSVAALTGAASAALLVLVCDVVGRHEPGVFIEQRRKANDLQQRLLEQVEDDAAAFRAYLDSQPGSSAGRSAAARVATIPTEIGRACGEVARLARVMASAVSGDLQLDLGVAQQLAQAAPHSALDMAEHNLGLIDSSTRAALQAEIARLR